MSAGTTINGVEIPAITAINESGGVEVEEIDLVDKEKNLIFKGVEEINEIEISFVLTPILHSSSYSLEKQRQRVKTLENSPYTENNFSYMDYEGQLVIEGIDLPESGESQVLIEGSIQGFLI